MATFSAFELPHAAGLEGFTLPAGFTAPAPPPAPGLMPYRLNRTRGLKFELMSLFDQYSKCRCGPVTMPVSPTVPMISPWSIHWPSLQPVVLRCP